MVDFMTYNPGSFGTPAASRSTSRLVSNGTGSTITKGTPVRASISSVDLIDVSSETQANAIAGIVKSDITNGNQGDIIVTGIIEDITTSASVGDIMYVSKTGDLTNIKPSIGVASFVSGDWVIRVGVIIKNNSNPLLKDLLINIQVVGAL